MSYNNVYLMKSLVFNRPLFKSKTQVDYEDIIMKFHSTTLVTEALP